ncbi:hypothetical protein [Pseudoxanthomonas sacheonensis]|uniref:Uncharacterized protein n=1 Tax=Pseudoxanthomonas sacheonensis TaxID=443615 RepID=A0ABU1RQY9_9GAMM|nr:hypothetical protein [Pseudoxanthomonas sacheonensis]MDR6841199.1 hypothetical protein [Pseudoxanthomonas sacheonensis]
MLIVPEPDANKVTRFRMCAEAAPDVFSAYASSLSGNLGLGATERNAAFANSMAETAATVERTQTINLLRESMYRTCERYLSGALNEDQFIIQAARDQKSMVAVLAIEQLTGAIRAKPTIISGPATSASVIDGTEAAKLIGQFRVEESTAKTNLAAADKAYASANKAGKCDTVAEKPAADAKDPTADEWLACKSAETMVAQRKDELKTATSRLDKALTLAADFVSKSNASTTGGTNEGLAYTVTPPGDDALIAVAQAVENIVTSPGIDEPLMFCIAYFQRTGKLNDDAVKACTQIISDRAKDDRARQQIKMGIANAAGYRSDLAQGRRHNSFMQRLFARIETSDPKTLANKMVMFETRAGTNHGLGVACTSREACKSAVRGSDLSESYLADEAKLEAALRNWDKPKP